MELLSEAERLYDSALAGIAALPASGRLGIATARLLYREIGRGVVNGIDPVARRSVVTRPRKLALVAEAIGQRYPDTSPSAWPALPEARDMIRAVMASPQPARSRETPPWWQVEARTTRMLELLHSFQRSPAERLGELGETRGRRP